MDKFFKNGTILMRTSHDYGNVVVIGSDDIYVWLKDKSDIVHYVKKDKIKDHFELIKEANE